MKHTIYQIPAFQVDEDLLRQMAELVLQTWPKEDQTVEDKMAFWKQLDALPDAAEYSYVIDGEKNLLAMARTFGRWIQINEVRYHAMGLSSVVVNPQARGLGLGREIALSAFSRVDKGEFHLSIFQTNVPEFYQKLGCMQLHNKIINSLSLTPQEFPFWDKYVMCYPQAVFDSDAVIDLHGAGY